MKIQQLSIFVENREGRLAQITEVLAAAQIDIPKRFPWRIPAILESFG